MKTMTATERAKLKARLLAETETRHAKDWERPGFAENYAAWEREYNATVAMYKARQEAKLTQAEVARRMNVPRASVYRIEHGQNVTIATLTKYLRACGFDFRFSIFPLGDSPESHLALA